MSEIDVKIKHQNSCKYFYDKGVKQPFAKQSNNVIEVVPAYQDYINEYNERQSDYYTIRTVKNIK